ncbi:hypothetical protein F4780DRAFT_306895 [Xylariomycetidae sp. FL0641]|nr:hypothetical protein F4780DRAFT_306895 [Xylariomycetidae sp. FL0641]
MQPPQEDLDATQPTQATQATLPGPFGGMATSPITPPPTADDIRHQQFNSRQLREADRLQRVHRNTQELMRLVENFGDSDGAKSDASTLSIPMSDDDLGSMLEISKDIQTKLHNVIKSRKRTSEEGKRAYALGQQQFGDPATQEERPMTTTCSMCNRTETPRWRSGPGGDGTLCNVCGLLYRKRKWRGEHFGAGAMAYDP